MAKRLVLAAMGALALAGLSACGSAKGIGNASTSLASNLVPTTVQRQSPFIAALGNGMIGGAQLDPSDRNRALEAEYRALEQTPAGRTVTWNGENPTVSGEVVAATPYQVGSQNCRQYTHTITTNGVAVVTNGTACRNEDGSWTPLV